MPELPDITAYVEALGERAGGATLVAVRLKSAFVLRSVHPPLEASHGRVLTAVRRLGKRIVLCLEEPAPPVFLVMLLMRAGRLSWVSSAPVLKGRRTLAAFDFTTGTAVLTEAGTTRRASLYVVEGTEALARHDPGGLEILAVDAGTFGQRLQRRNHTLKRALTDPSLLAGVGGAYADEILHHARLSPTALTQRLREDEVARLYVSSRHVLQTWTERAAYALGVGGS